MDMLKVEPKTINENLANQNYLQEYLKSNLLKNKSENIFKINYLCEKWELKKNNK